MFRWITLAILVTSLGVSGYYRRRARRDGETIERTREGPALLAVRLFVALPMLATILLHIARPDLMTWATWSSPSGLRWLGVALGVAVVPGVRWVLASLGRNVSETVLTKSDHALVTTGPYRWVRHPLYSTGVTLILSIGLMLASWVVLGFALVAAVLILTVVIPREEQRLIEAFGDDYRRYMADTGRLLPRTASGHVAPRASSG
jgi:protein-S-isoprenylcysteine O-methyltransferase Ste14